MFDNFVISNKFKVHPSDDDVDDERKKKTIIIMVDDEKQKSKHNESLRCNNKSYVRAKEKPNHSKVASRCKRCRTR